jgi:hypothetical protein
MAGQGSFVTQYSNQLWITAERQKSDGTVSQEVLIVNKPWKGTVIRGGASTRQRPTDDPSRVHPADGMAHPMCEPGS